MRNYTGVTEVVYLNTCNGFYVRFYRAAWNADAILYDENSVCPSVCLCVKRVNCDKTEEQSVQIFSERELY